MRKKNKIIKELRADIKQLEEDLQTVEPDGVGEVCYTENQVQAQERNIAAITALGLSKGKDGNIIMVKQTAKKVHTELKKLTDGLAEMIYESRNGLKGQTLQYRYLRQVKGLALVMTNMEDAAQDITSIQSLLE